MSGYTPVLKDEFKSKMIPQLQKDLKLDNINQVPKLEKIVLNVGLGRDKENKRIFEVAANTLRKITGQEPVETFAKKSIAGFKLREGQRIGVKVTLRGNQMYEFYDRLVNIVMPRLRDFHGIRIKSIDASGNISVGLPDQSVFPELSYEDTATLHGLEVIIVTSANNKEGAKALLTSLGMPFEKENK